MIYLLFVAKINFKEDEILLQTKLHASKATSQRKKHKIHLLIPDYVGLIWGTLDLS